MSLFKGTQVRERKRDEDDHSLHFYFFTDWSKYATPQTTFNHLRSLTLTTNGIVEINVGNLRHCIATNNFPLALQHDPIRVAAPGQACNRAHTLIIGITQANKAKILRKLSKILRWAPNFEPVTGKAKES